MLASWEDPVAVDHQVGKKKKKHGEPMWCETPENGACRDLRGKVERCIPTISKRDTWDHGNNLMAGSRFFFLVLFFLCKNHACWRMLPPKKVQRVIVSKDSHWRSGEACLLQDEDMKKFKPTISFKAKCLGRWSLLLQEACISFEWWFKTCFFFHFFCPSLACKFDLLLMSIG